MPETNYNGLKKIIDSNSSYNLYLLEGEMDIVNYFEAKIVNNTLGEKHSDFDFNLFKGENLKLEKLSLSLQTYPITSKAKCTVIKNLAWESSNPSVATVSNGVVTAVKEEIDELLAIISDIPSFTTLIIIQTSKIIGVKNTSKFKKIQNFVRGSGIYASLTQKDISIEKTLVAWAKEQYSKELSLSQAKEIKKSCPGYSISEIKNELKKISIFFT